MGLSREEYYDQSAEDQIRCLEVLARKAFPYWGVSRDAELEMLKLGENGVFAVQDRDKRSVLRVHRAGYHTDAELISEMAWVDALSSESLRTPQIIPTLDGPRFVHVQVDEVPEERQVSMFEWMEGEPIGGYKGLKDESEAAGYYETAGELMALTHNHSESWTLPEGFVRHAWDEDGLFGENPFWGRYWEHPLLSAEHRGRLAAAKGKARSDLGDFGKGKDRYGLIHADFIFQNLFLTPDGICLIDFDDAGFGWHMFDVATPLFFALGTDYKDAAHESLVKGYRKHRKLPDDHLGRLSLFLLMRGLTYLSWTYTRTEIKEARDTESVKGVVAAVDHLAKGYL